MKTPLGFETGTIPALGANVTRVLGLRKPKLRENPVERARREQQNADHFVQRGIEKSRSANISKMREDTYADKPLWQQSIFKKHFA